MASSSVQLAPSPYSQRLQPPTLTPPYYTSELFVTAARTDIGALLTAFNQQFGDPDNAPPYPFTLFKSLWSEKDWNWIHFVCEEPRSRIDFLKTMFRLFIERIDASQPPAIQSGALFGMYIFHATQPPASSGIYGLNKIPIAIDTYLHLLELPKVVPKSLSGHVLCLLDRLESAETFTILPESSLHPYHTRTLPSALIVPYEYVVKSGRPSRAQLVARSRAAVTNLEEWTAMMDQSDASQGSANAPRQFKLAQRSGRDKALTAPPTLVAPDVSDYVSSKEKLKGLLPRHMLIAAEDKTRETMKGVEQYALERGIVPDNGWRGIQRMKEQRSMLDFVKPAPAPPS